MPKNVAKEMPKTSSEFFIIAILILSIALVIATYLALSARERIRFLLDETLHEVNIPLSTIFANAKLLSYSLKDERQITQLKRLESAAKNLHNLLGTLESNIRNELVTPKSGFFDGAQTINGVVADLKELYANRQIKCNIAPFWCETDEHGFMQAIRNLLHNALKFSNDFVKVELDGEKLTVSDYGCGIDAAKIAFIFERYYQASINQGGSGIGLFVVKRYCDASGIKIFIKSNTPNGTIFTLDLSQIIKKEPNADKNRV